MSSQRHSKIQINTYVKDGKIDLSSVGISPEEFAQYHRICIVACGSAYHVGIAAKYVMVRPHRINGRRRFRF